MTNSGPQIKRRTFCGTGCIGLNSSFQTRNYNNYSLREANTSLWGASKSLRGAKRCIFVECNKFFEIINITVTYLRHNFLERILILSGDIKLNQGPIVNNNVLSDPNISTFR